MPETELLLIKTETLPPALFEKAVQSAYFAEKLAEAEHEANKPNALWLEKNDFWNEDENKFPSSATSTMQDNFNMSPLWTDLIYR